MTKAIEAVSGEALHLKPLVHEDLPYTLAWRNRDEARVWFKHSEPVTEAQHQGWFESYLHRGDDMVWVVWAKGRRVGQVAAYDIDHASGNAEVGRFLAAPEAMGRGYMQRACTLLLDYCRERLNLRRVYLEVLPGNERAIRLYKGLGFVVEREDGAMLFMERFL